MKRWLADNVKRILVVALAIIMNVVFHLYNLYQERSSINIILSEKKDCVLIEETMESEIINSGRNASTYLLDNLVYEMGDVKPVPADFFRIKIAGEEEGLMIEATEDYEFVIPLTDELLHTKGKYVMEINCNGTIVAGHLEVVDTTPPMVIVPEKMNYEIGETILYRKDVKVTDNSGEELDIIVDNSGVISNVAGNYVVCYSAIDSSGNIGEATCEIVISQSHKPTKEEVEKLVEELLVCIVDEDMTQLEQVKAIFDWCYSNIRYTSDADKSSLMQGAYDGIYYQMGDCFTYFATAAYMMDCCGIDNLSVSKKDNHITHYWSLVNVGNGWYHFDCSPHKGGYKCFMQTDEQVKEYAKKNEKNIDYFTFDEERMPQRAVEIIYGNR